MKCNLFVICFKNIKKLEMLFISISLVTNHQILFQSKKYVELELDTVRRNLDAEVSTHKETVAKFNADKKNILMTTEESNTIALKGLIISYNM